MIIQHKDLLINLDNVFSIKPGGQGNRFLIVQGTGASREQHLPFENETQAKVMLERIIEASEVISLDQDA